MKRGQLILLNAFYARIAEPFDRLAPPDEEDRVWTFALGDDFAVLGTEEGELYAVDLAGGGGAARATTRLRRVHWNKVECLSADGSAFAAGCLRNLSIWRVHRRYRPAGGAGGAEVSAAVLEALVEEDVIGAAIRGGVCAFLESGLPQLC